MRRRYVVPVVLAAAVPGLGYGQSRVDDSDLMVSQLEAERTAVAQVTGTVVDSDLTEEGGTPVWDIQVEAIDGQEYEVEVDGTSGNVLASAPALPEGGVSP